MPSPLVHSHKRPLQRLKYYWIRFICSHAIIFFTMLVALFSFSSFTCHSCICYPPPRNSVVLINTMFDVAVSTEGNDEINTSRFRLFILILCAPFGLFDSACMCTCVAIILPQSYRGPKQKADGAKTIRVRAAAHFPI